MDALINLKTRRAIRKFKHEQIKDEELKEILEAGTYAPTAMGLQSPLILAIQNEEDVKRLNELSLEVMRKNGFNFNAEPYYGAPTIILIFRTNRAIKEIYGILDASSVTTNMLNAANALGLGSIWIDRAYEIFESEKGKELLHRWNIDEEVHGVASIGLGYKDTIDPSPKARREGYYKIIK